MVSGLVGVALFWKSQAGAAECRGGGMSPVGMISVAELTGFLVARRRMSLI